jgi:hypothetical protein
VTELFDQLSAAAAQRVAAAVRDAAPEITLADPAHAVALVFEWGAADEYMWMPLTVPLAASRRDNDAEQRWDPYAGRELAEAGNVGTAQERLEQDQAFMQLAGDLLAAFEEEAESDGVLGENELTGEERYAVLVVQALAAEPPAFRGLSTVDPFLIVPFAGGSERFPLMMAACYGRETVQRLNLSA